MLESIVQQSVAAPTSSRPARQRGNEQDGVNKAWKTSNMSCDIHTHSPAQKSYANFILYHLLFEDVLQTGLGMGMGMNGTAHSRVTAPR